MRGACGLGPGRQAIKDEDFGLGAQNLTQRNAFRDMGDEESVAAFSGERWRDPRGAKPIGVRLYDTGTFDTAEHRPQPAIIFADRPEIDGENGAGLGEGRTKHANVDT